MSYSDAYSAGFDQPAEGPPPAMGPLNTLLERVAAALEQIPQVAAGDWTVMPTPYDAVTPPAFMVQWGPNPWFEPATMCANTVAVEVVVIGDRLTVEANYLIIGEMVDAALTALDAARLPPWQGLAPAPFPAAEITWLAARLHIRQPVPVGGS